MDDLPFASDAQQVFSKLRMRNTDQREGALSNALAVEMGDPVFRHHVMNVSASCDHARTFLQAGNNSRELSTFRRGHERDNRLAALAARSPAHEIQLAAKSA